MGRLGPSAHSESRPLARLARRLSGAGRRWRGFLARWRAGSVWFIRRRRPSGEAGGRFGQGATCRQSSCSCRTCGLRDSAPYRGREGKPLRADAGADATYVQKLMSAHVVASSCRRRDEPVCFPLSWFFSISDAISRLEVFALTPLCRSGGINERGADVQLFLPRPGGARVARLS